MKKIANAGLIRGIPKMLGKYCFASMEMIKILQLYEIILQVNID